MCRRWLVAFSALLLIGCGSAIDDVPVEDTPVEQADDAATDTTSADPASSPPSSDTPPTTLEPAGERSELRRGDRGPVVRDIQGELVRVGFTIDVDGVFGPATESAIRAVQFVSGLDVDGIAGPKTRAALDTAIAGTVPILASDGLVAVDFGDPADVVVATLTPIFGPPTNDATDPALIECDGSWCEGRRRVVEWGAPDDRWFAVVFDDVGGGLEFAGWQLRSMIGDGGFDLATSEGVRLGSRADHVSAAYPDAVFGFYPEPACGDSWWSPGEFAVAEDRTGLAGSVGGFGEAEWAALDQALVDRGFADGLNCAQDVMCAEVFGRFQESAGLPVAFGLDRATWSALGLPLPFDAAAPVTTLRAGQAVVYC